MPARRLLECRRVATMVEGPVPYGLMDTAGIAVQDGWIAWVGALAHVPTDWASAERTALPGLITPALVDCHTHLVHGGHRAAEFEQRLMGVSYEDIAQAGGGILSTVRDTRALSAEQLAQAALPRVDRWLAEGVTTLEIKSGYGLSIDSELRMLEAARLLPTLRPVRVRTSYLAAHAVPPEFQGQPDAYVDQVVLPGLDQAHAAGLVDAVDGFVESIAFTPHQMARVFDHAGALGLPVKLHAEQLSNQGGARLAARYDALSADHLEYLDRAGVTAMSGAGTVATLLPGAFYTLKETKRPPIALLREGEVPMAVATDYNPGSSPLQSLLMSMNMACTLFSLTPEEALAGTTRVAAQALGLEAELGTVEVGKRAELACWDAQHPAELPYQMGATPLLALHRAETDAE